MLHMPTLITQRLLIRPLELTDLDAVHRILDVELGDVDFGTEGAATRSEREEWLRWSVLNYEQLARLYQPPYGERGVVLRSSGELIGAVGFVPSCGPFEQLRSFAAGDPRPGRGFTTAFGLYYAMSAGHQRRGFASEAVQAMIAYAFGTLRLQRVIATTTHENTASIAVMRRLGFRIERNPFPEPPWFQVVGVLDNPSV